MSGLFFLLSVIVVGLLLVWMVRNDHVRPDGRTEGLFAMADEIPLRPRRRGGGRTDRPPADRTIPDRPIPDRPGSWRGQNTPTRSK